MSGTEGAWLGEPPSWRAAAATLYGGVVALMIAGVQPLVFGALVDVGRIGLADLGRIATLESLGMAVGSSLGSLWLRRGGARALCAVAALAVAAGNLAMPAATSAAELLALRGAVGLAEGALLSLTIALISRAPAPERWSGAFLGIQTLGQSAGAWAIPAVLAPSFGANAGAVLLGAMAALAVLAAPLVARELPRSANAREAHGGRVPGAAWIGLAFVLVSLASSSALWSYFERLGDARGLAPAWIGAAAATSLVAQAVGSFVATGVGPRLGWLRAVGASALAQLAAIAALHAMPGSLAYAAAGAVFGFFWLFGMPYQVRALVELDPSRSSARLIARAQILGGALGPLGASALVRGEDLGGVLGFAAASTLAALALSLAARGAGARALRAGL